MNDQRGQMVKSVQFGNLEKKTQKLVPLPTTNVIRKKSN